LGRDLGGASLRRVDDGRDPAAVSLPVHRHPAARPGHGGRSLNAPLPASRSWDTERRSLARRLERAASIASLRGKLVAADELFARYFIDLTPRVALIAAQSADRHGNLYTGPNTEDTPVIVEATAFKGGIVVAQVDEIVDTLPRVDIPADWVSFVAQSPHPHYI